MRILREKIECLRRKMDRKLEEKNFIVDDEIVKLSQLLDKFIAKYQKRQTKINRG
ncbi:MAG: aspartyl-phosphate phosphatase Spo0E family protein [Caloramator sp.]|nr:aspartyl-phosphate phosphatase Spo0E family protein [Caloramator sp.]